MPNQEEYFIVIGADLKVKLYIVATEEFTVSEEDAGDILVKLDRPLPEEFKNRVGYFYLNEIKE